MEWWSGGVMEWWSGGVVEWCGGTHNGGARLPNGLEALTKDLNPAEPRMCFADWSAEPCPSMCRPPRAIVATHRIQRRRIENPPYVAFNS
jgi:hypothetical protein